MAKIIKLNDAYWDKDSFLETTYTGGNAASARTGWTVNSDSSLTVKGNMVQRTVALVKGSWTSSYGYIGDLGTNIPKPKGYVTICSLYSDSSGYGKSFSGTVQIFPTGEIYMATRSFPTDLAQINIPVCYII